MIYLFKSWSLVSESSARGTLWTACGMFPGTVLHHLFWLKSQDSKLKEWDVDCQCVTNKNLSPQISKPDIFAKTIAISYFSSCISYSSHSPEKQCMTSFIMIYASVWAIQEYSSRFAINQLKMFINKVNE